MGWSLLHPLAMTAVLFTVFTLIYPVEDKAGFALYLLVGLTTWSFLTTALNHGCQAFFRNESYIRQHPAPLAIYPLRVVLGADPPGPGTAGGHHHLLVHPRIQ